MLATNCKNKLTLNSNSCKYLLHINVQGLLTKLDELNHILQENKCIDVISINEHWLNDESITLLNRIKDFVVADSYLRHDGTRRGGTAILVRNISNYTVNVRNDLKCYNDDYTFECSVVEIKELKTVFVSLYRVPYYATLRTFLNKIERFLGKIKMGTGTKVVISTDCNIDVLSVCASSRKNVHAREFVDMLEVNGFKMNVREPTRITKTSKTCIDNIITNYNCGSQDILVFDIGISDHNAIFFPYCASEHKPKFTKLPVSCRRNFNRFSIQQFCELISSVNWDYNENISVDGNYDSFLMRFMDCFNASFPKRYVKQSSNMNKLKWMTKGIKVSCEKKRELHMLAKTTEDITILNYCKSYKKMFKKVVNAAKRLANDKFINNAKCKSKAAWSIIKENFGENKRSSIKVIEFNKKTINDPKKISDLFNDYFVEPSLNSPSLKQNNSLEIIINRVNTITFKFEPVTYGQVRKAIDGLKNKRASGWDEIPVSLIKYCKDYISHPLVKIINQSFRTGRFPDKLKYSIIKPIFKKGNRAQLSNYRPIALLPAFSKVFEKIVNDQLSDYLVKNGILSNTQHGFRTHFSTTSALSKVANEIHKAVDKKENVAVISFDLSKAFDMVNHSLLLKKLRISGVIGVQLEWFESYLNGRRQQTVIGDNGRLHYSGWRTQQLGVPQGSVLGPLLFILYVNDLQPVVSAEVVQFADDTTSIIMGKNDEELVEKILTVSNDMSNWCSANNMVLNCEKTNILRFKTKNHSMTNLITMNDAVLKVSQNCKILGVYIDDGLNWKEQIMHLVKKLNSICFNIRCLSEVTSLETRKIVYFGYFYPLLKYGVTMWGGSVDIVKVFKIQKRVIRTIMRVPPRTSCRPLFRKLGMFTLPCLYIYESILCVRANIHDYLTSIDYHRYNTRNRAAILYPVHRTSLFETSPYYSGIRFYNKASVCIDMNVPDSEFRKNLKKFLIDKAYYAVSEFLSGDI
jgi:uncharacterized protein YggL (DUF469 family)